LSVSNNGRYVITSDPYNLRFGNVMIYRDVDNSYEVVGEIPNPKSVSGVGVALAISDSGVWAVVGVQLEGCLHCDRYTYLNKQWVASTPIVITNASGCRTTVQVTDDGGLICYSRDPLGFPASKRVLTPIFIGGAVTATLLLTCSILVGYFL